MPDYEPRFESDSPEFDSLVDASAGIEQVATGFQFTEGPVWVTEWNSLLFSDIPANRIMRWSRADGVSVWREPSDHSNGLTRDAEGAIIACHHGTRNVTRITLEGETSVIADRFDGRRLNSPNDVVVKSDGAIYFTDPPYGIQPEQQEQPVRGVYRVGREGDIRLILDTMQKPNGLAFSPDEQRLYVDDSGARNLQVFAVKEDGALGPGSVIGHMDIELPGSPDGMKVSREGHVFCTAAGGVWVFGPDDRLLGRIVTPEKPSNCAWGDDDWQTLYITARTSLYRVRVRVPGVPVPVSA